MARILTSIVLLSIFLAGCGGGGSSSATSDSDKAQSIPNNFSAKSVQVVTPDPRIGYPLKVTISLTADAPADNVSVSVFAIENTDDPSAEVHQTPLGTQAISHVEAGTHDYEVDVNTIAAEYYNATGVVPCIDPDFAGNPYNLDDTGSSYCKVDLALLVEDGKDDGDVDVGRGVLGGGSVHHFSAISFQTAFSCLASP